VKGIQGYEMRHMQAESRETTYQEKERRDPYMNSGGSAPADMGHGTWAVNPQMGEPRGDE
jgi:hypothetical protein